MQKKIIALAVAGLVSGAAFAQTNVTLYGVADIGYGYLSSGDNKFSGMQDGGTFGLQGSRIGFRGEEALGNGLKAIFTIEYGVNLNDGANAGFRNNRQSFVGLSGGFGTLTFGRQYSPSGAGYLGGTVSNGVTSVNVSNYMIGNFVTMQTGNGSRWDNSIAYDSPNWSGLQFRAVYGFGNNIRDSFGDASTNGSKFGLGAKYANGPLYLTAIYQATLDNDGTGLPVPPTIIPTNPPIVINPGNPTGVYNTEGEDAWAIGGAYDFKVVKVFANYIRETQDAGSNDLKKTYWSLGLSAPVSAAGTVKAEYGRFKTNADESRSHGISIGYEHAMSKRTTLYTYLARISNQDNAGSNINRVGGVGVNGESQTGFAMGINHKF